MPSASAPSAPPGLSAGLVLAAIAAGPLLLFWHVHRLWNPEGDYAYGWVVPLLTAYLIKSRWDDRPAPSTPVTAGVWLGAICALAMIPARWLHEAAPERSVCGWGYGLAAIGVSLSIISLIGGVSWRSWFGFPLLFSLTAIPWPHSLETLVTRSLMNSTAGVTVEILCLAGIPSVQSGHLVQIENGILGIDEACSGIRSLQAMVMVALFLGELCRLKNPQRFLLLVCGLAITLLANVIRTVALSSIGFSQGMSAVDRYHDSAGLLVLLLSLSATTFLAYRMRDREPEVAAPAEDRSLVNPLPFKFAAALLIAFGIGELAVEGWYRTLEPKWPGWAWTVLWPEQREGFKHPEIPQRALNLLMCDDAQAAAWRGPDGSDWSAYWLRWNPGNPAADTAKVHRPDVCLNAAGAIMQANLGVHEATVNGLKLSFRVYVFQQKQDPLFVFFTQHEEGAGEQTASEPQFEGVEMLSRAKRGVRRVGMQSLEIAISGYALPAAAEEAFMAQISQIVQPQRPASGKTPK